MSVPQCSPWVMRCALINCSTTTTVNQTVTIMCYFLYFGGNTMTNKDNKPDNNNPTTTLVSVEVGKHGVTTIIITKCPITGEETMVKHYRPKNNH